MSAGYVHTKASLVLTGAFLLATTQTHNPGDIQYALGSLAGVLITPDLDVDAKFIAYKYIRERLGHAAEFAWNCLWYFYRRSIKHGSELSHFPVISTLFRIAYLYLFLILFPYLLMQPFVHYDLLSEFSWWMAKIAQHWKIIVGLMGADFIHYGLDLFTTDSGHGNKLDLSFLRRILP